MSAKPPAAEGKTDVEIGMVMGITAAGVDYHLRSARAKLDTVNRAHTVAQALRAGLGLSFEDITRFNVGGFPINNRNTVTMRDLTVPSEKQNLISRLKASDGI